MLNKKKIPKIHELDELLDDCKAARNDESFLTLRSDCIDLTKYKTEATYPGHIPMEITLEEAKAAIEKSRRIKDFVLNKAKDLGYEQ